MFHCFSSPFRYNVHLSLYEGFIKSSEIVFSKSMYVISIQYVKCLSSRSKFLHSTSIRKVLSRSSQFLLFDNLSASINSSLRFDHTLYLDSSIFVQGIHQEFYFLHEVGYLFHFFNFVALKVLSINFPYIC